MVHRSRDEKVRLTIASEIVQCNRCRGVLYRATTIEVVPFERMVEPPRSACHVPVFDATAESMEQSEERRWEVRRMWRVRRTIAAQLRREAAAAASELRSDTRSGAHLQIGGDSLRQNVGAAADASLAELSHASIRIALPSKGDAIDTGEHAAR